jgi:radical SAM protein with 4Fe4S-binding SPASM domain
MQILSLRRQFIADHSSTNYLFYAAKPISKQSHAIVSRLSSHVDVGDRTAAITYHSDYADLGDERRKKFLNHFDVEVRESYEMWTLSIMLESAKLPKDLPLKDFEVEEEASLTFTKSGKKVCLCFDGWRLDYTSAFEAFSDDLSEGLGEFCLKLREELYTGKTDALKASLLRSRNIRFGFNLIVTRLNLSRLPELLRWACDRGAATINLIRPKPAPGNDPWYRQNALSAKESSQLSALLPRLESLFANTNLTVDCAFSFLFQGWAPTKLRSHGVAGCAMGERFVTVKWNGDVYPCSHLHGEEFNAGNVAEKTFTEIWEAAPALARIRQELDQVKGDCGGCSHNAFCKGCRAVMQQQTGDWLAADEDCSYSNS